MPWSHFSSYGSGFLKLCFIIACWLLEHSLMCPYIINLCKLEGVFDFPTPYNHTASEQSREKGLPGWTCKKEKILSTANKATLNSIHVIPFSLSKDKLVLAIGLIMSLCISHAMPLEILAVTFHTLVGEVINQTVMNQNYILKYSFISSQSWF